MTPELSMKIAAVNCAVRLLCEGVGTLPLHLYQRVPNGKQRATKDPLYRILHDRANDEMPSSEWRQMAMSHVLLGGDSFNQIEESKGGKILGFWPMRPDRVEITRGSKLRKGVPNATTEDNLGKWFYYTFDSGLVKEFRAAEILQIPGLGYDGYRGASVVRYAADTLGLARGMEEFNSKYFANGAMIGGVVQTPGVLGPEGQKNLRESIISYHEGLTRAHRILLLEEGATFKETGMKPEDAQLLGSRKFEIEEIARFFNIPLHMLQSLDKATFSNIEHQAISYVVNSLRPWLVKWEQWINFRVLGNDPMRFVEFLVDGLLRGDLQSRNQSYQVARYGGWLSGNEIREFENMNSDPSLDDYWMPVNMVPAGTLPPAQDNLTQAAARVRSRYVVLFEQGIARTIGREIAEIRKLVAAGQKLTSELLREKVYDEGFRRFFRRANAPVFSSFTETMLDLVREPKAAGIALRDGLAEELVENALHNFEERHIAHSVSPVVMEEDPEIIFERWDNNRANIEAREIAKQFTAAALDAIQKNMIQNSGGKKDAATD